MSKTDERTIGALAREALQIQDACNLSGLAHSFPGVVVRVRAIHEAQGLGWSTADRHPIVQLWADKLASLVGVQTLGAAWVAGAYREVERLAAGGELVEQAPAVEADAGGCLDGRCGECGGCEADAEERARAYRVACQGCDALADTESSEVDASSGLAFRVLSEDEQASFRRWAREHYTPRTFINPVWHPVTRDECQRMDREASAPAVLGFAEALALWVERSQALIDEQHRKQWPDSPHQPRKLSLDEGGQRYVRVVATDGVSRSAFAFIERATGAILKPDGWKRPAKGVRGSIYTSAGIATTGALYR